MYLIHTLNKYSYFVILASSHFWEKQILINTVYVLSIPLPSSILLPFSQKLITMSFDVYYIYYICMQYKAVPCIQVYIQSKCRIKIQVGGTSLVVRWLRLQALTMQRTKILHVTRFGKKKKNRLKKHQTCISCKYTCNSYISCTFNYIHKIAFKRRHFRP